MKQKSKFDRAIASWRNWREKYYKSSQPTDDLAYANGWHYGYLAATKDAKKLKKKGGAK